MGNVAELDTTRAGYCSNYRTGIVVSFDHQI